MWRAIGWFIVITLSWMGALTFCLPLTLLLKYHEASRHFFFSVFYTWFIGSMVKKSMPWRKAAFELLEKSITLDRDKSVPLEVLEIGVAEGYNLEFYPPNCNLTALDVNKNFESIFMSNSKKYPHINYKRTVIQPAEDMKDILDNSMDLVVSTYVHCSCRESKEVLEEIRRVLKPDGRYLFLEHVCFPPDDRIGRFIHRYFNPLWYIYLDGCTINRDSALKIKAAGFSSVVLETSQIDGLLAYPVSNQIRGVAIK